jgi:hypothetical protein
MPSFSDDFNRADATTLGDSWNTNAYGVSSNRAYVYNAALAPWAFPTVTATNGSVESESWFPATDTASGAYLLLAARSNDAGLEIYYCAWSASTIGLWFYNGTNYTLAETSRDCPETAGIHKFLRMEVSGSAIRVLTKVTGESAWTENISATDTNLTAAGHFGFLNSIATEAVVDNFVMVDSDVTSGPSRFWLQEA